MIKYLKRRWKVLTYYPGKIEKRPVSSVFYESEEYKELKGMDRTDQARLDILTETSYALHDADQAGDRVSLIRICKEALEKLDALDGELDVLDGKPGRDRIVRSIQELRDYQKYLVSQSMSDPSPE